MRIGDYTEDYLIEKPSIALFVKMGWQTANCYDESFGSHGSLGRQTKSEVLLISRLLPALERLNPDLPPHALQAAITELQRDRSLMSAAHANQLVYQLLKNGVNVTFRDQHGVEEMQTVRLIDWDFPAYNDFFVASQFWITGEFYTRRPDLIGFVNGIPLLLIELKAPQYNVKDAFDKNLRDYKAAIPHIFWYTAFVLLSNGSETVVGSQTSPWEHFKEWKRIDSEDELGVVSLETTLQALCKPERFLDMVENFILYEESQGGLRKLIARNHQYLGVNQAFQAIHQVRENQGKLGVFWHTQGSGKSYSMIFLSQKTLRKLPGNWTFLIVTDRKDLDEQIYKKFARTGSVIEEEQRVHASNGYHLQQLLREDHRYVFTLIQKFITEKGKPYPVLSERDDIIVITDEAHRSQYDILALNMRNALPNAAFLAFTGTPLMAGEELTRQVFGDYVSIYNFKQSVDDKATVPLYYENRIPEVQLTNQDLNEDMQRVVDEAELDEEQERKLEREFSREYHIITRDGRLERIAEDIMLHFMGRGFKGKAMVVTIDKATALQMYNKVQKHWKMQLAELLADYESRIGTRFSVENPYPEPQNEHEILLSDLWEKIDFMQKTDMAVVVSQGQNEIEEMRAKGLDILPHRKRMLTEDLDEKFKNPQNPFRIVFVCAMWMTGFDVESCSTIYLDKPMRNHTLMQAIARANRVYPGKNNGLIIDYIGIFRNLQKALAIYGSSEDGGGDLPVESKQALIDDLRTAIQDTSEFLKDKGIHLHALQKKEGFELVAGITKAVDKILINDQSKKTYLNHASLVNRLFKAVLPDLAAREFNRDCYTIRTLAQRIRSLNPEVDITQVMGNIELLLDDAILPAEAGFKISEPVFGANRFDLSKIDFDTLRQNFEKSHKRIEIERLRGQLNSRLKKMVHLNRTRMDYYERLQELIDEYNAGIKNEDAIFAELISFTQGLNEEEKRKVAEQLSEEELTLFDILTKPEPKLKRKEKEAVKAIARKLLDTLKAERLVLDWRKRQQSRAAVQLLIQEILETLPDTYNNELYNKKCDLVYQHIYDSYYGDGKSIYQTILGSN
jgi:type I restriction enzyme, R subunit